MTLANSFILKQTKPLSIAWCCKKLENVTQAQFDSSKHQGLEPTQIYSFKISWLCRSIA